jgi:HSP20 family molecular chaperone IbpA
MDFLIRTRLGRLEPNADVFLDEERGQVVVTLEMAGAEPDTLSVALDDRHLAISGRRRERTGRGRSGSFVQKEIAYGEFAKHIPLPVPVEYENAHAALAEGMLTIVLPIAATAYLQIPRTELRIMVTRTHS